MFATTSSFLSLLLFSLIVGAMLGFFYDLLSCFLSAFFESEKSQKNVSVPLPADPEKVSQALFPFERRITSKDIVRFVTDIFFWIVSAFAVCVLIFHLNFGKIRAFSLVSAVTGFTVWEITVGRPIKFLLLHFLKSVKRVVFKAMSVLKRILSVMLVFLLMPLIKPILQLSKNIISAVHKKRVVKKTIAVLQLMESNERTKHKKDRSK